MKVIKWGILGSARIAEQQFIPAIKEARGAELLAVASRTKERALEFAKNNGIPRAYESYEELLDDPDVDAVYIPLPNDLHAEWTIRAAKKGKHVLCEKPAALDAKQTAEMVNTCSQHGVVFMEAFMYQFHPQWKKLKELLQAGVIGELKMVNANFSFFLANPENIRLHSEKGGGALYDVGCYCVNVSRLIMGSEPTEVRALGKFASDGIVDYSLSAVLKFPDQSIAHFDCSFEAADRQFVEVVGSTGSITMNLPYRPDKGTPTLTVSKKSGGWTETFEPFNVYAAQIEHFCLCIVSNRTPVYSPEQSIANMKVIDAIYEAAGRKQFK